MNIKKIADSALAVSIIGVISAFPFHDSFPAGLLFSTCSAAAIGGLADSFAVSALFGNPLNIKWPKWIGTNIISKNKNRLIDELIHMVQNDLLTINNIKSIFSEYNISNVILNYLKEHGGKEDLNEILQQLVGDIITKVDIRDLSKTLQSFLLDHSDAVQVAEIVADVGDWTISNGYDEKITEFIIQELIKLVKTNEFHSVLEKLTASAISSYENGKFGRKIFNSLGGLKPAAISSKVQDFLEKLLKEMISPSHPYRIELKKIVENFVIKLRTDYELRNRIEEGKKQLLETLKKQVYIDIYIQEALESYRQTAAAMSFEGDTVPFPWIGDKIQQGIMKIERNEETLARLDEYVKSVLLIWIETKHHTIGDVVFEKLNNYNEQELINLVKERAGNDLQYIRLNGIGVGALVGTILYLTTFWIGA
ncbi:DUF445 domain-containing protein [Paenibacillus sediminis]|uniref:Uncharacterized membrane-anchored protein YjiN (DUF445 family) n=1 Tax=Paenibacillus sediminis TaxID=664909 RepID=A0ABS4H541_9BACL|nr:DUF445 domain-containing protein [Paenibacillus sediminis]MBP1937648.1 uncharacterized membrane-anchored protein YjiN (DUF445 family) [Paenibacillus sediminis]